MLRSLIILLSILLIISMIALAGVLLIWVRRDRHTRERFAFASLIAASSLVLALGITLYIALMPWHLGLTGYQAIKGYEINIPKPQWSEYFLVAFAYLLVIYIITRKHREWSGRKSIEEYHREQRGESISFWAQGLGEALRILKREAPPQPYIKADSRQFLAQLESVTDSLAWKDQARDLIRFTSSSYYFDQETGWHDREGCWVGRNIDTDDLVFLYPSQSMVSDVEQNAFVSYAYRFATDRGKEQYELIIALKEGVAGQDKSQAGRRIRFETETSLLNNLVDFTDYSNEIRKRVLVNNLPDSTLNINDVYVPSHYFRGSKSVSTDTIEEHLLQWLDEPSQRQLALLGEYGQGKSTAALMLTYHILSQYESSNPSARIPILIELRGTSPRNHTPLQLLGAWAAPYNINPQALLRLHIAGRLLLIFEGFDEMALVGDAEMRLKHFKTVWQFCYPKAKILITGRPNFFLDEEEMKAALGISKPIGDKPYCEAIRLAPFDLEQISKSLRRQEPSVKDQICSLAEKNPRFLELVSRPSLLHIVSVLWEKAELSKKVERLNSAFIMDLFVGHSYRRQGLKQADVSDFMALTSFEREYFMSGIAAYMAAKRLPNQINKTQLNDLIEHLIDTIPDSISTQSPAISGESNIPLRLRLQSAEHGVEHVKTDVRACGLLVDDPAALGTFRFGHKSFMEYLFAALLAEYIQVESSIKSWAILRATDAKIEDVLSLPVSLDFLSEQLDATANTNPRKKSDEKHDEQASIEYSNANRLLKRILSEGRAWIFIERLFLFNEVCRLSARKLGSFRATLVIFFSPIFLLSLLPMIFMTFYILPSIFKLNMGTGFIHLLRNSTTPLVLLSMIIMMFLMIVGRGHAARRRKLALWCHICRGLGIKDHTMHRVIGTWMLPWAKDKPFDFYIDRLETEKNKVL